ncbi:MAG TPA: NAD(P)-dependent oxidoreductase [Acidimicrobiales bacterium]|nr:NAD(P)-dependent oxidoreductase [Acidimicrobiales bacterium]
MKTPLLRSLLSGQERFAVTGASGWLGRTALDLLAEALGPDRFREAVVGFASTAKAVTLRDGTAAELRPLGQLPRLAPAPTHLLHFAYLTRDRVAEMGVPAYVEANTAITATVVGAIDRLRPAGVFGASSGAVYRAGGGFVTDVAADPYGALKHLEELAIRRAAADAGGRSVVARIFSLTGAYMTRPDLYALGDLVQQALAGGPMVVRARGPVERSYCAAGDVVTLALCSLLGEGDGDVVFDTGGDVVEVGELAELVREAVGAPVAPLQRSWDPAVPADRYVGDGARMSELAARQGLVLQSLQDQVRETASYLAS